MSGRVSKPIKEFTMKIKDHEPYVCEMKKTEKAGRCVFLEQDSCGIYESRPLICRFYPFQLAAAKDGKYKFLYTGECPGIGKGKKLGKDYFESLFRYALEQLKEDTVDDER